MIPPSIATLFAKPLVKYGMPVLLVVLGFAAFQWWLSDVKKDARQEGVTQERTSGLIEIINTMEKADETRRDVADPASRARYDECVQSARNPENCQRFMPQ